MSTTTSVAPVIETTSSLTPGKAKECDLKLVVSDAQIASAIYHLPSQTFFQIISPAFAGKTDEKTIGTRFIDLIKKNPILEYDYNSVNVAFLSQDVTLVPNILFDSAHKDDYIKLIEPPTERKLIIASSKEGNEFTTVFSEEEKLVHTVKVKFPNCTLSHSATYLIDLLQKDYANDGVERVFAYVLPDKLQLIIIGKNKPVFYNIFSYTTPEDFIYYILLVYKKLGFDPEKTQLIFLGEILSQSKLFELTLKYIRNIAFGKRQTSVNYSEELKQLPPHFYYSLFSMV